MWNRRQEKGGAIAKGGNARWTEFIAGDFAPLDSLGQIWEEVFYFGLTFFIAFFASARIYGGLGVG